MTLETDLKILTDGTKNKPREGQREALQWLVENWRTDNIKVIDAPTGLGKSYIARAIQLKTGAHILTPSNPLVRQYAETYPELNYLYGIDNYKTKGQYKVCRQAFRDGAPTIFNPISYYYHVRNAPHLMSPILIVDEAHNLKEMLRLLFTQQFSNNLVDLPEPTETAVLAWAQKYIDLATPRVEGENPPAGLEKFVQRLYPIVDALTIEPDNVIIETAQNRRGTKFLNISTIKLPIEPIRKWFRPRKVILLSATIEIDDVYETFGDLETDVEILKLDSPIDPENRKIVLRDSGVKMNSRTPAAVVVNAMKPLLERHRGENMVIHLTYSKAREIAPLLIGLGYPIIQHDKVDKHKKLALFKSKGGILLACGMSEGVDFKYDLCSVQIIPILYRPNISSMKVKKMLKRKGGTKQYNLEIIRNTIQRLGRSTRAADDKSVNYILDGQFKQFCHLYKNEIPDYILAAIYEEQP